MFITLLNYLYCSVHQIYNVISFTITAVHTVLPFGLDVGAVGVAAYYLSRLKKPNPENVNTIFGHAPGSKEAGSSKRKEVRCIAHRGAGLDAPENTLEAFKYCVEHDCDFVELDVRSSKDGRLVLLHDRGLGRIADSSVTDVRIMDWDSIKDVDVGVSHPNKSQFKEVRLCLLDQALDYLLDNKARLIIDVKGDDAQVVNGILKTFKERPTLYKYAAVTCFNPFTLYQIRRRDPEIVGALSYRPYAFSAQSYDAETGPRDPRFGDNPLLQLCSRAADALHALLWRRAARCCSASAVLLHKDIVSPAEVQYWRSLDVRCCGWCVNRPLEKLYWRGVLRAPYLSNTLMGEPELQEDIADKEDDRVGPIIDKLLEPQQSSASSA